MPKSLTRVPTLLTHHTGHCRVKIDGKEVWLGSKSEPDTREKYDRLIGVWLANGRRLPLAQPAECAGPITVSVVMAQYVRHIDEIHPTNHGQQIKDALSRLRKLYGSTPAEKFTPGNLEVVRATWIEETLTRSTINRKVNFIRAMFRWAVARGLVPPETWQSLTAVEGLRQGRSKAKESRKVGPAPQHLIDALKDHVSPQVWALVQLQLLTAARSGELLALRACDFDMSGEVWTVRLSEHKTAHHGHDRILYFGPKAQEVLQRFLPPARPIAATLFNPRESNQFAKAQGAKAGRRPNQKPNRAQTDRTMGEVYTNNSYRRAVERGLEKAFPIPAEYRSANSHNRTVKAEKAQARRQWRKDHKFHPHQLRHNAATMIRRLEGADVARIILGHSGLDATEIYAEADQQKALDIIRKIG